MNAAEYAALEVGTEPWREGCLDWCVSRFIHLVGLPLLEYRSTEQESRTLFRQDIAAGRVRILHCTISRAVEFPVDEDERPGYFLELGERQVLYLHNLHLLEYERLEYERVDGEPPPLLPNRQIDVVQTVVSRATLNALCLGEPLGTWETREEWPEDPYSPSDGEILALSLDTLDDDLKRLGSLDRAPVRSQGGHVE